MFIYQEKGGYCYNSDTLFLYDFISKKPPKGEVLDVGCGCGILGLLLCKNFDIKLSGIDIQSNCIKLSKINAKNNSLDVSFFEGDFSEFEFDKKFDMIVSNPPFYEAKSKQSQNSAKRISRFNDSLPLKDFISKSNSLLKPRGELVFCYDVGMLGEILYLLKIYKITCESLRFIHPKRDKVATVVLVRAKKSSKSSLRCLPPLVTHKNGEFSEDVKNIYKSISLKSLKCEL